MNAGFIDQIFSKKECIAIKQLYTDDPQSHKSLRDAIGARVITEKDKIITANLLDVLFLMCLTAKFASSEDECYRVAVTMHQFYNKPDELSFPSLETDRGLIFASKCLITLSFHFRSLEKRWKFHGAPSPDYYRQTSKATFASNNQKDIASHHEQWEGFLGEITV